MWKPICLNTVSVRTACRSPVRRTGISSAFFFPSPPVKKDGKRRSFFSIRTRRETRPCSAPACSRTVSTAIFPFLISPDFAAKDLRALYACPSGCSIQLYGKLVTTEYWKIICLNRVCIDGTEWTAQTPVEETDHYEIRSDDLRWNFENRAELESYLDVVKVFPAATKELCGEELSCDESELLTSRDGPSYIRDSISYGTVFARHAVNWCDDLFPPLRVLASPHRCAVPAAPVCTFTDFSSAE